MSAHLIGARVGVSGCLWTCAAARGRHTRWRGRAQLQLNVCDARGSRRAWTGGPDVDTRDRQNFGSCKLRGYISTLESDIGSRDVDLVQDTGYNKKQLRPACAFCVQLLYAVRDGRPTWPVTHPLRFVTGRTGTRTRTHSIAIGSYRQCVCVWPRRADKRPTEHGAYQHSAATNTSPPQVGSAAQSERDRRVREHPA